MIDPRLTAKLDAIFWALIATHDTIADLQKVHKLSPIIIGDLDMRIGDLRAVFGIPRNAITPLKSE